MSYACKDPFGDTLAEPYGSQPMTEAKADDPPDVDQEEIIASPALQPWSLHDNGPDSEDLADQLC